MLSRPSTANGRIFVPKNRPHHDYAHEFHVHAGASEYLLESQHGTLARSTHGYRYKRQSHVVFSRDKWVRLCQGGPGQRRHTPYLSRHLRERL
jgi:hypothetical protein